MPVVIHDTLNPTGDRSQTKVWLSQRYLNNVNNLVDGSLMFDDFGVNESTDVRIIGWQGAYCDGRFSVPDVPPSAVARSFRIAFFADLGGGPAGFLGPPLHEVTVSPSEAGESRMFDAMAESCGSKSPAAHTFFSYTAQLPRPFRVEGGRRYWISISADVGNSLISWGWRVGRRDNGRSYISFGGSTADDLAMSVAR